MNTDQYIVVKKVSDSEVVKIIQEVSDLYHTIEYSKGINIYKSNTEQSSYLIGFTNKPDFERFKYFVNYIEYPETRNPNAIVRGYCSIGNDSRLSNHHIGDRVLLYVSKNDEDFDNVHGQFKNHHKPVLLGFASGEEYKPLDKVEIEFDEPTINKAGYSLLKTISPDMEAIKKSKKGCFGVFSFVALLITGVISFLS